MSIILGKDVSITGVNNARSVTVSASASEVDCTKFGDTSRKFKKSLIEQTIEVECVDDPGVAAGDTFSVAGTQIGDATYVCTSVAISSPLDGITTYTVSGSRTVASS